jgi:hypothetical protein
MNLFEMFNPPIAGMQDIKSDNSKPEWETTRKSKLTLKQLRHLRKMLDVRNYEKKVSLEQVRTQYGNANQQQGGGPPA